MRQTFGKIYHLSDNWTDDKSERWEGHYTVKLYMGSNESPLKWDIKPEDFENIRKVLSKDGVDNRFIVNTGFGAHNTVCFQYVMKSDTEYYFNVVLSVLEKRLLTPTNNK